VTDSDTYECPVEGCDYGEQEDKTLAQVRGHVNSSGDEAHVWQDVKHTLLAEAEKREATQATEDDDSEAEEEQGDPGEVPGPNGETGHLGTAEEDDQSDDDEDSTEMASQEEYEEQYSDEDGDLPEGDEADDQPEDGDEDVQGGGFTVPAVSASTVVLVVGVGVAALLVWKLYSGGDAASNYEAPEEQADTDSDTDGGMAAVEAGTGGVQV